MPVQRFDRSCVARALLLVLALPALVGCQAPATTGDLEPPPRVRIMAYNIKHGAGMDGAVDLERIAAVIRAQEPDVVTLQEVDDGCGRTDGVDQAQRLAELCGMHAVFGPFMDYDGGRYGMALLSRHPIVNSANHRLPAGAEPRTSLAATIRLEPSGRELVVVGIHFYRTEVERLAQAEAVLDAVADERRPVVLAGDFNSTPGTAVMRRLEASFVNVPKGEDHLTFPSDAPDREIDYFLYRPAEAARVLAIDVIDEPIASDHRPLVLDLELLSAAED